MAAQVISVTCSHRNPKDSCQALILKHTLLASRLSPANTLGGFLQTVHRQKVLFQGGNYIEQCDLRRWAAENVAAAWTSTPTHYAGASQLAEYLLEIANRDEFGFGNTRKRHRFNVVSLCKLCQGSDSVSASRLNQHQHVSLSRLKQVNFSILRCVLHVNRKRPPISSFSMFLRSARSE